MGLTLELPDDLAASLSAEASALGITLPEYALQVLATVHARPTDVKNGADLVAYWQASGVIGSRTDITDPAAYSRHLREQVERRNAEP
jgi:hypothetical protein